MKRVIGERTVILQYHIHSSGTIQFSTVTVPSMHSTTPSFAITCTSPLLPRLLEWSHSWYRWFGIVSVMTQNILPPSETVMNRIYLENLDCIKPILHRKPSGFNSNFFPTSVNQCTVSVTDIVTVTSMFPSRQTQFLKSFKYGVCSITNH